MTTTTSMKKTEIIMDYAKTTPNMVVFQSRGLAVITSVYIHKSCVGDTKSIKISVEPNIE